LDLLVTLVGFTGQIQWDLPVILNWISRSFSVGLSIMSFIYKRKNLSAQGELVRAISR
jgi:hypothetical protein